MPSTRSSDATTLGCLAGLTSHICCGKRAFVESSKAAPTHDAVSMPRATFRGNPLPYNGMSALSEQDLECINQRHFYKKAVAGGSAELARHFVGAGRRCRHGWPQAVVFDPLYRERPDKSFRLGDTTRLTCPLLVAAIDKLEKGGAMERYNELLLPGEKWDGELQAINEAHRLLRLELIGNRDNELAEVRSQLGEDAFAIAIRSGIASLRPEAKPDVKCLHAQVADEFVRGGGNPIAQQALRDIEDQGLTVDGTDECCDNCNVGIPLGLGRWQLSSCKNNVGKRLSRGRRQANCASRAGSIAGDITYEATDDILRANGI